MVSLALACGSRCKVPRKTPLDFSILSLVLPWLPISTCSVGSSNQESLATPHAAWSKQSLYLFHLLPVLVRGTLAPFLGAKSPLGIRLWSETRGGLKGFQQNSPPHSLSCNWRQPHVSTLRASVPPHQARPMMSMGWRWAALLTPFPLYRELTCPLSNASLFWKQALQRFVPVKLPCCLWKVTLFPFGISRSAVCLAGSPGCSAPTSES